MGAFTLTRAMIRAATGWGYGRTHAIIITPYRLESQMDPAGPKGGGRTERFRLSDVLARARTNRAYDEHTMTPKLLAADAAQRKQQKSP